MKKEKSGKNVASKQTLNLAIREKGMARPAVVVPLLVLIMGVAALLSFAVASRLAAVVTAQREVNDLRAEIAAVKESYGDFDEVKQEYNRYTYKDFDRSLADRMEVLALMEREIMPVCYIQRFSLVDRTLNMTLEGLTLETTSHLITRLNADKLVESVSLSTYDATAENGAVYPVTDMVILLADASLKDDPAAGAEGGAQ